MPLRDHFHSPWSDHHSWKGFHSAWANTIVRHLNGSLLPPQFRAVPQVHFGARVEADVATFEQRDGGAAEQTDPRDAASGLPSALWAPPEPVQTIAVDFPDQDVYEVQVFDERRGTRLVAVVELVSPSNKDRSEHRRAFVSKCAAYLQERVSLLLVDIVTERRFNLHRELLELLAPDAPAVELADLYAVAYRTYKDNGRRRLKMWPAALSIGSPLPTLPLWLAGDFSVPVDLEKSYEETCQVLRIT